MTHPLPPTPTSHLPPLVFEFARERRTGRGEGKGTVARDEEREGEMSSQGEGKEEGKEDRRREAHLSVLSATLPGDIFTLLNGDAPPNRHFSLF
jgi:hypothetical protein